VAEKCQCIEPDHPSLSIKRQCELIGLVRASYYRDTAGGEETAENLELMRLIDEEYTRHPFYGSRQIRNWLRRQGGKGRWVDNVFVERLWRSVKYEDVYLHAYETPAQLHRALARYFDLYNSRRRHSAQELRNWQPETQGRFHLRHCPVIGVHFCLSWTLQMARNFR